MTPVSRSRPLGTLERTPSAPGAGRSAFSEAGARRARSLARALLGLTALALGVGNAGVGGVGCLPPDFEIEPEVNQPVTIDRTAVTPDPRQFTYISECRAQTLALGDSVSDPDEGDPVSVVWLVNYQPGLGAEPDLIGRTQFKFDPCTNPKAVAGQGIIIMALVLDRPVPPTLNADEILEYTEGGVTSDFVTWSILGFEDRSCCLTGAGQ